MRVQNNIKAINANGNYRKNTDAVKKNLRKLASGYDINTAGDNAAGLAISEKMRSQITELDTSLDNIVQGKAVAETADGALQEVNNMLIRAKELTLAAQNSIYSSQELKSISDELSNLTSEIDRIAKGTDVNGIKPLMKASYSPGIDVKFNDVRLKADLTDPPLRENGRYSIGAKTVDGVSGSTNWSLVFGDGSTSYEQIRIRIPKYDSSGNIISGDTELVEVSLNSSKLEAGTAVMDIVKDSYSYNQDDNTWSLTYSYKKLVAGAGSPSLPDGDPGENPPEYIEIELVQSIKLNDKSKSDSGLAENNVQYYEISYEVQNKSSAQGSDKIGIDFMHHFDTAYNNNDSVERYYVEGSRVEKTTMYEYSSMPDSFSIWGPVSELPFTGSVMVGGNKPDYLYLGHYRNSTPLWTNFDQPDLSNEGVLYPGIDLGFSMVWKDQELEKGSNQSYSFQFGIKSTETDSNIKISEKEERSLGVWIQGGINSGFYIHTCDATAENLALDPPGLSVENLSAAVDSLNRIDRAIGLVVSFRGKFGSDMNRLESAENVGRVFVENLTASESRIRDVDMAREYADFVKNNILTQSAQAMLAQANQQPQGILQLLQ